MHETAGLPTSNYHVCPLLEDLTLGNLQEQTTPRLRGAGVTLIVVGFVHQDCSAKADTWSASATPTRSAGGSQESFWAATSLFHAQTQDG